MADWGMRPDGTPKGTGYFGPIKHPNGRDVSTELSADSSDVLGGKLFPLLVPTLTREEIDYLISGKQPTTAIFHKAASFAKDRAKKGFPLFAAEGEIFKLPDLTPPTPWADILAK